MFATMIGILDRCVLKDTNSWFNYKIPLFIIETRKKKMANQATL